MYPDIEIGVDERDHRLRGSQGSCQRQCHTQHVDIACFEYGRQFELRVDRRAQELSRDSLENPPEYPYTSSEPILLEPSTA